MVDAAAAGSTHPVTPDLNLLRTEEPAYRVILTDLRTLFELLLEQSPGAYPQEQVLNDTAHYLRPMHVFPVTPETPPLSTSDTSRLEGV